MSMKSLLKTAAIALAAVAVANRVPQVRDLING
jgi:hypothetical protein